MNEINATCPSCGSSCWVDTYDGQTTATCPHCGQNFNVQRDEE